MEAKHREYNSIDLLKFIFSICIVGIHATILNTEELPNWMLSSLLFRTAVPFFMIVSAYFLAERVYANPDIYDYSIKDIVKKYFVKFIPPLILWGGAGLLLSLIKLRKDGESIIFCIAYAIRSIIFYPRGAMWYLQAVIIGGIILILFYQRFPQKWERYLFVSSIVGYAIVLLCGNYYFVIENNNLGKLIPIFLKIIESPRNGIFLAPIFMLIGFWMKKFESKWQDVQLFWCGGIVAVGLGILAIETIYLYGKHGLDDRGYFLGQILFVPSLIIFGLKLDCVWLKNINFKLLRRLSTTIFYIHSFVLNVIRLIFPVNTQVLFWVGIIIPIGIGILTYKCSNKYLRMLFG